MMTVSAWASSAASSAGASIMARPKLLHSGAVNASEAPGSARAIFAAAWMTAALRSLGPEMTRGRLAVFSACGDFRRQREHCFDQV